MVIPPRRGPLGAMAARGVRGDGGYLVIWVALLLPVLIGMAALGVDVGMWYVSANEQQKAADAAALAGAARLPSDPTAAAATARQVASANGFTDGTDDVVITTTPTGNRLSVTIAKTVPNSFGPVLGINETTVTRSAQAAFEGPVSMGSPCNTFGDDPDPSAAVVTSPHCGGVAGEYWAAVAPPGTPKNDGDAYQSGRCDLGTPTDLCSGTTNTEYDPDGYFYLVRVAAPLPSLTIEAFDPAAVTVDDVCHPDGDGPSFLDANARLRSNRYVTDGATRYAQGTGDYCTGDTNYGGGVQSTRFAVRSPSGGPDLAARPLESRCAEPQPQTFAGYNGPAQLSTVLNNPPLGGTYDYVARVFRRWVPLCTIGGPVEPGSYVIQVKTNGLGHDGPHGQNAFSLRAHVPGQASYNTNVSVHASGKMAIFANLPSAATHFHLARLPSGSAGRTLTIRVFDLGDAEDPGQVQVVPPPDWPGSASFTRCQGQSVPRTGTFTPCQFAATDAYNGRWMTLQVPIPSTYTCTDAVATSCWWRLRIDFPADVLDTTSWQAYMGGSQVRITE
jgi:hypothetical protein